MSVYRDSAKRLLQVESLPLAPLPDRHWPDDRDLPRQWPGDLSNAAEQEVSAIVCRLTKMDPRHWDGLEEVQRLPWLEAAIAAQETVEKTPSTDPQPVAKRSKAKVGRPSKADKNDALAEEFLAGEGESWETQREFIAKKKLTITPPRLSQILKEHREKVK